jgi:cyclopropane fatty-acyl-phospholipid synthase-like methyltransferase
MSPTSPAPPSKALSGSTESTVPAFSAEAIRDYYDRQTRGFLALGEGGTAEAIHRAVWDPQARTADDAFHYTERRMREWLSTQPDECPHVVDLGCGVGGSLRYLARHLRMTGTGVTVSPVQASLGTARSTAEGLAPAVRCLCGDFNEVPLPDQSADAVMAIEAFVHGATPARFFAEAARLLKPGGRLWLCDDFRNADAPAAAQPHLARFEQGWHLNALLTPDTVMHLAREAGLQLVERRPLTGWLRLGRPRDYLIAAGVALLGWLPLERTPVAHLVGGAALQRCLARGWVTYELLVFSHTGR